MTLKHLPGWAHGLLWGAAVGVVLWPLSFVPILGFVPLFLAAGIDLVLRILVQVIFNPASYWQDPHLWLLIPFSMVIGACFMSRKAVLNYVSIALVLLIFLASLLRILMPAT